MAFLKTEWIVLEGTEKREVDMKYDVSVDKEGYFTTTIPKVWADKLKERMIETQPNRLGNPGFFSGRTLDELNKSVSEKMKEYVSRELIEEKVVLRYAIRTTCSYCLNSEGEIVPNGAYPGAKYGGQERNGGWKYGTIMTHDAHREPYGLLVYVEPFMKYTYRYRSGQEKSEYKQLCYVNGFKAEGNLFWLDSLSSIAPPNDQKIEELDYDESVGLFFVNMIKSICMLNEKIKDFIHPEAIRMIASQGFRILNERNE